MSDWEVADNNGSSDWEAIKEPQVDPALLQQRLAQNKANIAKDQEGYNAEFNTNEGSIVGDVMDLPMALLQNLQSFTSELDTEIPGAYDLLRKDPVRAAKDVGYSFGGVGKSIVNSAYDLSKYLQKKSNIKFPIPFTKDWDVTDLIPHIPELGMEEKLGIADKQPGDRLLKATGDITLGYQGLKQGLTAAAQAKQLAGKTGNKILEKFNGKTDLKQAQDAENMLKKAFIDAKEGTAKSQLSAANNLTEQQGNLLKTHQEKSAEIESMLPNLPERQIKANNVEYMTDTRQNLKNQFDQRYNEFGESSGVKPITQPYSREELAPFLDTLNPAGQRMAEGLMPQQIELSIINPETGSPFVLDIPAENATVSDYIDMMRTARDARSKLKRDMDKPSVTRAEEMEMNAQAQSLRNLQQDAERRVQSSLTPEEFSQFQTIQNDYRELYRPFMDNKDLFDAWFNKKDTGNIFTNLTQPAYARLYNHLSGDENFRNLSLSNRLRGDKHPLSEENPVKQAKKINSLLKPHNADITENMSDQLFSALKSQASLGNIIGATEKQIQSLSKSMMSKATEQVELSKAKILNPEGKALLDDIESKQLTEEQINKRMKKAGINTAEEKANFNAARNANRYLKQAASLASAGSLLKLF